MKYLNTLCYLFFFINFAHLVCWSEDLKHRMDLGRWDYAGGSGSGNEQLLGEWTVSCLSFFAAALAGPGSRTWSWGLSQCCCGVAVGSLFPFVSVQSCQEFRSQSSVAGDAEFLRRETFPFLFHLLSAHSFSSVSFLFSFVSYLNLNNLFLCSLNVVFSAP